MSQHCTLCQVATLNVIFLTSGVSLAAYKRFRRFYKCKDSVIAVCLCLWCGKEVIRWLYAVVGSTYLAAFFLILEIRGQILTPKQRIELREMLVRVGIIADGMWLHT